MYPRQSLILLVEDNPDHAELTKSCLSHYAMAGRVVHMTDGSEAIDYLMRSEAVSGIEPNPLPALVLLDLRLPKVGGLEVLRTIRRSDRLRMLPVVILTTSEAERDVREAYEFGANGYAVKPIDYDQLQKLIADICTFWLMWNRLPSTAVAVEERLGSG
jgi:two-component system response regulator